MKTKIIYIAGLVAAIAIGAVAAIFAPKLFEGKKSEPVQAKDSVECTAAAGDIVYVNMDRILAEYDYSVELTAKVEAKVKGLNDEVTRRGKKLEKEFADFQSKLDKGLMVRSVAEDKARKLEEQKVQFEQYAATKQQEAMEEQQVMLNKIGEAIKTFMEDYNEVKNYAMILVNQANVPIITGSASLDITDDVIAGLNEDYANNKSKFED